ncbi:uncharacterized protein FOKN1_0187 [Thiohalobacter thiocyanaticus]|uniref:Uncharacterized protein n=1 Tax=Thiohalobacter thiocyanaticus TaxID=585455 RepID=A0A1Z4VLW3_9GAMM|nr:uncharacterized protein FOKN1_0187 [Thiohalobacter thiocyanaticus]
MPTSKPDWDAVELAIANILKLLKVKAGKYSPPGAGGERENPARIRADGEFLPESGIGYIECQVPPGRPFRPNLARNLLVNKL